MLNIINDLSVSSLSSIGFEVKWHSSQSDNIDEYDGNDQLFKDLVTVRVEKVERIDK